jgi:hypothetical protein
MSFLLSVSNRFITDGVVTLVALGVWEEEQDVVGSGFWAIFARAISTFIWTDWKPIWPIRNPSEDSCYRPELKAGAAPKKGWCSSKRAGSLGV